MKFELRYSYSILTVLNLRLAGFGASLVLVPKTKNICVRWQEVPTGARPKVKSSILVLIQTRPPCPPPPNMRELSLKDE
jgi:hypothetical protein